MFTVKFEPYCSWKHLIVLKDGKEVYRQLGKNKKDAVRIALDLCKPGPIRTAIETFAKGVK